jgi:hypothetical protein
MRCLSPMVSWTHDMAVRAEIGESLMRRRGGSRRSARSALDGELFRCCKNDGSPTRLRLCVREKVFVLSLFDHLTLGIVDSAGSAERLIADVRLFRRDSRFVDCACGRNTHRKVWKPDLRTHHGRTRAGSQCGRLLADIPGFTG